MNDISNGNNSPNPLREGEGEGKGKLEEKTLFIDVCMCWMIKTWLQSTHSVILQMYLRPMMTLQGDFSLSLGTTSVEENWWELFIE